MNNLTENILKMIKEGEVTMQPRWHFVLRTALMMSSVVLVSLIAVYLFSFVLFTLHKSGLWFAPQFGHRGLMLLVIGSPWLILSLLGIFLLVLYVLVSHYSLSYRKPLVYSMVSVVFSVVLVSSVIQYFGMHDRMESFIERNNIQGLAPLYRAQDNRRPPGVLVGTVMTVSGDSFVIHTDRDEILTVYVDDHTRIQPGMSLSVDTEVLVFGRREGTRIDAFGMRSFERGQSHRPPLRRQNQKFLR